jgi:uncharacterized protein DUF6883
VTLPNAHLAVVEQREITEYLLNPAHPQNGGKARFFASMGLTDKRWQLMVTGLSELAKNGQVVQSSQTAHGRKFIVDGDIDAPSGNKVRVRSVWIVDQGKDNPRLVTAYPQG